MSAGRTAGFDGAIQHYRQGLQAARMGRLEEALVSYGRAISLNPGFKEAYANRALLQALLRRPAAALADFDRAIELGAGGAQIHVFRASALIDLQRPADAIASADRALALRPDLPAAHVNLGAALYLLGRYEEALSHSDRAISQDPCNAEAHAHRGAALYALRRLEPALASLDVSLALQPQSAFAHNLRGLCLVDLQRSELAVASCLRAIELRPDSADAYNSLGLALGDLRRFDEAIASFDRAIALQPQLAEPQFNKGVRLLQQGDFAAGWDLYERRPRADAYRRLAGPGASLWDGRESLAGKTILTYSEQGLGDTLQFCRYATLLASRGARVVLRVQTGLGALLRGLGTQFEVVECAGAAAEGHRPARIYDFQCPLLSLPRAFRTRLDNIPAAVPYLTAEPDRVAAWRERLGVYGRLIGIRWQGSTGRADAGRSFPLQHFRMLAGIPGVRLVSLQKGEGCEQLSALSEDWQVEDLGEQFEPGGPDAFLDVAAVMQCLELVITSDTSIAHLAGALGRPTWLALKYVPDWRWLLNRDDCPWYPTLRLFRQAYPGDWEGVFTRMRHALST